MKMNSMAELLERFKKEGPVVQAPPPHELAATVNLIRDANLFSEPTYGYTFWLGKVKRAGVSYSDMVGMIKNIKAMDGKYNKGGTLNNQLTKLANARKSNEHERQGSTLPKKRATLPRTKE